LDATDEDSLDAPKVSNSSHRNGKQYLGKGQDWLNIEVFLELDQAHHLLVTTALYNAYTSDKAIEYLIPGGIVSEDLAK